MLEPLVWAPGFLFICACIVVCLFVFVCLFVCYGGLFFVWVLVSFCWFLSFFWVVYMEIRLTGMTNRSVEFSEM